MSEKELTHDSDELSSDGEEQSKNSDLKCPHPRCGKTFKSKYSLKRHTLSHLDIKKYVCPHCDRRFILKQYLKDHMYIHTGEKPFRCTHAGCDKSFRQRGKLSVHNKMHQIEDLQMEVQARDAKIAELQKKLQEFQENASTRRNQIGGELKSSSQIENEFSTPSISNTVRATPGLGMAALKESFQPQIKFESETVTVSGQDLPNDSQKTRESHQEWLQNSTTVNSLTRDVDRQGANSRLPNQVLITPFRTPGNEMAVSPITNPSTMGPGMEIVHPGQILPPSWKSLIPAPGGQLVMGTALLTTCSTGSNQGIFPQNSNVSNSQIPGGSNPRYGAVHLVQQRDSSKFRESMMSP